jgi:hypothetical protein
VAFGTWNGISWFKAIGEGLFALSSGRLWLVANGADDESLSWTQSLKFVVTTWPGCLSAAAWTALGSEVLRVYPFAYVVSLLGLSHLLYCTVLGLPLYRVMVRQWARRWGSAEGIGQKRPSGVSISLVVLGSLGAVCGGLMISQMVYKLGLWQPFMIGTTTGWVVSAVVVLFLLMQGIGVFRR